MPECKAAMLRNTKCLFSETGICLVLENETINDGKINGLERAMTEEDSKNLEPLANDRMGPTFKMCAKREKIIQTAQKVLKRKKNKK